MITWLAFAGVILLVFCVPMAVVQGTCPCDDCAPMGRLGKVGTAVGVIALFVCLVMAL